MVPQFPIISIAGQTATGKTELALAVASAVTTAWQHNSTRCHLISLDSRQVYQGLEVLSGADIPAGFTKVPEGSHYESAAGIQLHGVSCVLPTQQWSIGEARRRLLPIIAEAVAANEVVLLVGGTGLYHARLLTTDPQIDIPPNQQLRSQLQNLSIQALRKKLAVLSPKTLATLNHSDRHNPTRLVRHIEKATFMENQPSTPQVEAAVGLVHQKTLVLTAPKEYIHTKIAERVAARFEGAVREVKVLQKTYGKQFAALPAASATGCGPLLNCIAGELSEQAAKEHWVLEEFQYAKRQRTWWQSHAFDTEFDVSTQGWLEASKTKITDWLLLKH